MVRTTPYATAATTSAEIMTQSHRFERFLGRRIHPMYPVPTWEGNARALGYS